MSLMIHTKLTYFDIFSISFQSCYYWYSIMIEKERNIPYPDFQNIEFLTSLCYILITISSVIQGKLSYFDIGFMPFQWSYWWYILTISIPSPNAGPKIVSHRPRPKLPLNKTNTKHKYFIRNRKTQTGTRNQNPKSPIRQHDIVFVNIDTADLDSKDQISTFPCDEQGPSVHHREQPMDLYQRDGKAR